MPATTKTDKLIRRLAAALEAHGLADTLPPHLRGLDACPCCGEWLQHDDDGWGTYCPACTCIELVGTGCPE